MYEHRRKDNKLKLKIALLAVGATILVIVMSIGLYNLGWWIEEDSVNRTAEIDQNSYQREQALTGAIINDASEIARLDSAISVSPTPQLLAQRQALVDQVCRNATLIGAEASEITGAAGVLIATECGA